MDAEIIATNLRRLRKDHGATQEDVAADAGLSRSAYRAIEAGKAEPKPETLRAIAKALEVPLRALVAPAPRLHRVRFRSLKRLKSREQILVDAAQWLHDFAELERLLDDRRPHALGPLWERLGRDHLTVPEVAAATRAQFGLGPREPVHDVCGLLESRGIKVRPIVVANDAFLGLSVAEEDGGPAVIVNTWDRLAVEHWIFSAAHELGHLVLHLSAYDVTRTDEDPQQEREAEVFAAQFLAPDDAFWREWDDAAGLGLYDRVLKVKRVFRLSWRSVLVRVAERQPPDRRGWLWIQMSQEHRRRTQRPLLKATEPDGVDETVFRAAGSEPAGLDAHDFQGDRLAALVRRAVEAEEITLARGAELLGIGIGEMRELATAWVT